MLAPLLLVTLLAPTVGRSATPALGTVCGNAAAELVAHMKSPQNYGLGIETAVIVDGNAYAEHATAPCGSSCTGTGEASLVYFEEWIKGTSEVAVPGYTAQSSTFVLQQKNGKAHMKWTVLGKTFEAEVDRCTGGLWTAAQGSKSAIIVQITKKLAPPK